MTPETEARFQCAFAKALAEPLQPPPNFLEMVVAQPGFAIYRNNVAQACITALCANFPTVSRLVGDAWMRAAAQIFVQRSLPEDSALMRYGREFPQFLQDFPPAAALTYLPGVALLDRYWTQSHLAADLAPVLASELATFSAEALGQCVLTPHPALHWAWFAHAPVYQIWSANRLGILPQDELVWQGEGAMLSRPSMDVSWQALSEAGCAFLDACAAACSLDVAAQRALTCDSTCDIAALLASLLHAGALVWPDQNHTKE